MSEFLLGGGLGFQRDKTGDVLVTIASNDWRKTVRIPAAEWCSVVAHVSVGGGYSRRLLRGGGTPRWRKT